MTGKCEKRLAALPAVLGALFVVVPACGSRIGSPGAGQMVCTTIGCSDQFSAIVTLDATMVAAGTDTLDVTADLLKATCAFPFPPADLPPGEGVMTSCSTGLTLLISPVQVCTTMQTPTVISQQCQPVPGKFTETIRLSGTPSAIHVQQRVEGLVLLDQTVSPTYQVNQPNGPMCGPICHQASATWMIPGGDPVEPACDPLAPSPITLGAVIGVGQDSTGTLYVDAANGIFVSSGGTLVRQHVIGSGQSGSSQFEFSFVAAGDAATTARDLLVQTSGGTAVSMALGPEGAGKTPSDAGVAALTLIPASTVSGMPVVNTPNVIQYAGNAANGNVLVATAPLNRPLTPPDGGVDDGGLSIFYGPPSAVAERPITAFSESLSGTGTVTFLVDGTPTTLAFGNVLSADAGPFGTFALMTLTPQGAAPIAITVETPTPTVAPAGLTFTCLR